MSFFTSSCSSSKFAHMAATWQWGNPFSRRSCHDCTADPSPSSPSSPKSEIREVWGTKFEWTHLHLSPEQLHPLKFTYDVLADECLNRLDAISPPAHPGVLPRNVDRVCGGGYGEKKEGKRDLYVLLRDNHENDEKLKELWDEVTSVPEWVDWDQIERGQEIFYRYGGPALTAVRLFPLLSFILTISITDSENLVSISIIIRRNGSVKGYRSPRPNRRLLTQSCTRQNVRNNATRPSMHAVPRVHQTRWRRIRRFCSCASVTRLCTPSHPQTSRIKARILLCRKIRYSNQ